MKVFYSRISTQNQNDERQLQDLKGFDYVLADKCSGLIPLFERPNGSQLRRLIDENKLTHLEIHSIDRLGRSLLPCLEVWNELTSKGITVVCRNPMLRNIDENGKPDKFSELMMSILATMSTYEKSLIKERQMEGIKLRQQKGLYAGRKIGTTISSDAFLGHSRSILILKYLSKGTLTYNEICKVVKCSPSTIVKTKKLYELANPGSAFGEANNRKVVS
jgi:DNA invertase Pin-like site-specific DNA recombinase